MEETKGSDFSLRYTIKSLFYARKSGMLLASTAKKDIVQFDLETERIIGTLPKHHREHVTSFGELDGWVVSASRYEVCFWQERSLKHEVTI